MKKSISFIFIMLLLASMLLPTGVHAAAAAPSAGQVATASGSLNVRSSPSTGASTVASLNKGSYITLIAKSGLWWQVEYGKGKYGYCHADYITPIAGSTATVNTQSGRLNVRTGAGTSYPIQSSLDKGETVIVLATSGSWSRILYNGIQTGYVSTQYLSAAASKYTAISLNVPSYKQTDSRWANVKIGTSGQTISKIGCATTAIAMIESYRSGQTIYPDSMSKKLSYTASGSVYWPSNFTAVTDSAGYLSAIYEQLKAGKPVLFGAKTSAGGQHWVVITGYTGGDTLTAAGFTVNDPGSNTRTDLQQFLNAYPIFYKYFRIS